MPDERGIAVVGALPVEQRLLRVTAEASRVELADHLVPSRAGVALVTTTTGPNRTHSMRSISSRRTNVSLHRKQIRRVTHRFAIANSEQSSYLIISDNIPYI